MISSKNVHAPIRHIFFVFCLFFLTNLCAAVSPLVSQYVSMRKHGPCYLKQDLLIVIVMSSEPFGLHYKVKIYSTDAREQFNFITDITDRG